MQLKDKFISSFLSIMLSAILTTIIVSIILLYRLNTNLSDNEEIIEIFKEIKKSGFQIEKIIPIS